MLKINVVKCSPQKHLRCNNVHYRQTQSLPEDVFELKTSQKKQKPAAILAFLGLTNALSVRLYSTGPSVENNLKKYPHSSGFFGRVPSEWFKKIPEDKRERYIKRIFNGYSQASQLLRDGIVEAVRGQNKKIQLEDFNKLLSQALVFDQIQASEIISEALQKSKILKPDEMIDLIFLGAGSYGAGFKFNVNGKDYVIKVYYPQHDKKGKKNPYHGRFIEPNRAMFLKKIKKENCLKSMQFTDCHFGNINSAFMVTDFFPEDAQPPETTIDLTSLGVRYGDSKEERYGSNMRNGNIIDYGGIVITNKAFAKMKTARYVYKKTIDQPEKNEQHLKWDEIYEDAINNKVANSQDLLIGLVSCVRFLPENKQRERIVRMAKEQHLSEKVLIHMAYEIADSSMKPAYHLDLKEKLVVMNVLFDKASPVAQSRMLSAIDMIDNKAKLLLFNNMLKYIKPEVKPLLEEKIKEIPEKYRPKALALLKTHC